MLYYFIWIKSILKIFRQARLTVDSFNEMKSLVIDDSKNLYWTKPAAIQSTPAIE